MANPSWSTDNISFTALDGAYRFGGRPKSKEEDDILLTADSGKVWAYNNFTKYVFELHWRVTEAQLVSHDVMDQTVGGIYPFYFSLSGAGAADSVYVRKDPGFDPIELDSPGGDASIYDYTLRMKSEIV